MEKAEEVILEKYYKDRLNHDKEIEDRLTKHWYKIAKKTEKRILTEDKLETFTVSEKEDREFREELLEVKEKISILGREISKLCNEGIRKADYLITLYPGLFLSTQEEAKEELNNIIYCFDNLPRNVKF